MCVVLTRVLGSMPSFVVRAHMARADGAVERLQARLVASYDLAQLTTLAAYVTAALRCRPAVASAFEAVREDQAALAGLLAGKLFTHPQEHVKRAGLPPLSP